MDGDKSETRVFTVRNQLGIHARPASLLAKTAKQYQSRITIEKHDTVVDVKSIMMLMTLAADEGTPLSVTATGEDASEALDAIEKLFTSKFGED